MWFFIKQNQAFNPVNVGMTNKDDGDFARYLGATKKTRKELLLEKCGEHDVSIYINDADETPFGVYAQLRAVASEAELELRLNSKLAVRAANRANVLAIFALLASVIALVLSFF
jgi:hypothetical protein